MLLVPMMARPSVGSPDAARQLVERAWALRTRQVAASGWRDLGTDCERLLERAPDQAWGRRLRVLALQAALETGDASRRDRLWASLDGGWPRLVAVARAAEHDPALAARWLSHVGDSDLPAALRVEARALRAELSEGGDPDAMLAAWQRVLGPDTPAALAERALARLARGIDGSGSRERALQYWDAYPDGPNRADVARVLSRYALGDARLARSVAEVLLDAGKFVEAERVLGPHHDGESRLLRARCRARQGDLPTAMGEARVLLQATDRALSGQAGLWLASWLFGRQEVADAIAVYQQVAAAGGPTALRALDRWAFHHRKHDESDAAEAVERRLVAAFPASEEANECRWRQIWRAHDRGRLDEAIAWARAMGDAQLVKVEGPAGRYWTGRLLEETGHPDEARASFERTVSLAPRSYYGWRARHRLAEADPGYDVPDVALRPFEVELTPLLRKPDAHGGGDTLGAMPTVLREAALVGEASWAWRWSRDPRHPLDLRQQGRLAWLAGRPAEAIAAGVRGSDPRLAYPLAFRTQIEEAVAGTGVPPSLLLSLVKQESRFDPRARSWVGATGLAQLMPGTATAIAQHQGVTLRPLTDPGFNLWLGARYLADVQRQLGGRAVLAVAAYNAGPRPVRRWIEARGQLPVDMWVERIPYPETRHYVKKVFANLWNYQDLYR